MLIVYRQEHHHGIENMGVEYGGGVEEKGAFQHSEPGIIEKCISQRIPVEQNILHTAHHTYKVCQHHIGNKRYNAHALQCLHIVKSLIVTVECRQFVVGTLFHYLSFMEHINDIGVLDGRKTVSNGYSSTTLH